jgi:hypothetical protein
MIPPYLHHGLGIYVGLLAFAASQVLESRIANTLAGSSILSDRGTTFDQLFDIGVIADDDDDGDGSVMVNEAIPAALPLPTPLPPLPPLALTLSTTSL